MTLAESILQCRLNHDWRGVVQCWDKMDRVEQSMHTMENSDVYTSVRLATREAEHHAKLLNADYQNSQAQHIQDIIKETKWQIKQ